jgi:Flp pilus assembly protein TadD
VRSASNATSKHEKREKNKKGNQAATMLPPWKIILGLFVVMALVLIVSEIQKPVAVPARAANSPASVESPGANMEALQHLKELEDQVKANPSDFKLLLELANHLHDNRFWDKAITSYKKYLDKNPKDENARVDLGICYKENGDLTSAKREMELVLKSNPKHLNAKFNLGIVALASGDLEASNEWFKKVVAQDAQSEVGQRAKQLLTQHNPQTLNN